MSVFNKSGIKFCTFRILSKRLVNIYIYMFRCWDFRFESGCNALSSWVDRPTCASWVHPNLITLLWQCIEDKLTQEHYTGHDNFVSVRGLGKLWNMNLLKKWGYAALRLITGWYFSDGFGLIKPNQPKTGLQITDLDCLICDDWKWKESRRNFFARCFFWTGLVGILVWRSH